jgi:hypothetical protein
MSRPKEASVLGFVDHHRQRYADKVRIAAEGEFMIGEHLPDGSLGPGGEFRVELVELPMAGRDPALHPRLMCFDDGVPALRHAMDAGLLDALESVSDRELFARRLIAIGMEDRSDRPLPCAEGAGEGSTGRRSL